MTLDLNQYVGQLKVGKDHKDVLTELRDLLVLAVLEDCNNNRSEAARRFKIGRTTMGSWLREMKERGVKLPPHGYGRYVSLRRKQDE